MVISFLESNARNIKNCRRHRMKIGELDQHCGNCSIVDYCAEPFDSLCLCTREELADVDEDMYKFVAEKIQSTNKRKISNQKMCDRICRDIRREQKKGRR